jgi:NADPH:quinone reductase-like Zn-dependent oxidoreductase
MKAAVHTQYGPPEVVQIKEQTKPVPKSDEVLIRVYATTVNRTDCGFRSAEYVISRFWSGLFKPNYQVLGCEFAGEVEAVGENVKKFKAGDKIFGYNDIQFGGHAQYKIEKEHAAILPLPAGYTYEEAAPIVEGAHYALFFLYAAKIEAGQQYLIYGATGAIGSAAVQLAKHFGAHVTAVCDTKNMSLVKSLGADVVIDYTKEEFTNTTKKFDAVIDAVGKSSFGACKKILKEKGIYVSTELGKMAQNPFLALLTPMFGRKKVLFPVPSTRIEDLLFLKDLVEARKFKPVVDRTYQLEEIVEAYTYVETGQKIGNVVIRIN